MAFALILEFAGIVLLGAAPSIVWLLFYLKEDPRPEPARWIFLAFISGIGAVPIALVVQKAIFQLTPPPAVMPVQALTTAIVLAFLGAAFIEEIAKFLAVRTLLFRHPVFNEPVDAMIYMVTAALGFAAIENMFILGTMERFTLWVEGPLTIIVRFIGANFLHTLASAIIGFSWALALTESARTKKIIKLGIGITAATLLHGAFNLILIRFGAHYIFLIALVLFVIGLIILRKFDILKTLQKPLNHI